MAELSFSGAEWNKIQLVEQRLQGNPFYEEREFPSGKESFYQGRPIIGRDRPINGGVYLGSSAREAIVVDQDKDPALNRIYQELLQIRQKAMDKGKAFNDGILKDVWDLVKIVMPYSNKNVGKVIDQLQLQPDQKVYLSHFIGGGICRHQALLAGYLLERLVKEGKLRGQVSIDRNYVVGKGGHAWVRYINSRGEVAIIDPAKNYQGSLENMPDKANKWFYERPEDIMGKDSILVAKKEQLASVKFLQAIGSSLRNFFLGK